MKLIYLLTGVLICCCSFSNCDKDENFTCVEFKDELTTLDPDLVQVTNYINSRLNLLFPDPTSEDPIGHEATIGGVVVKAEVRTEVTEDRDVGHDDEGIRVDGNGKELQFHCLYLKYLISLDMRLLDNFVNSNIGKQYIRRDTHHHHEHPLMYLLLTISAVTNAGKSKDVNL